MLSIAMMTASMHHVTMSKYSIHYDIRITENHRIANTICNKETVHGCFKLNQLSHKYLTSLSQTCSEQILK